MTGNLVGTISYIKIIDKLTLKTNLLASRTDTQHQMKKLKLTDAQKIAIESFFDKKPGQQMWNCTIGFLTAAEGMPVPDQMAIELLEREIGFADFLEQNKLPLSFEQRSVIEEFLADKPNKQVFNCENGFHDANEGVSVSDSQAIKWIEQCGAKFQSFFE